MVRSNALILLLLAAATSYHEAQNLRVTSSGQNSSNMTMMLSSYHDDNIGYLEAEEYYASTNDFRNKRESYPLIGPFDISKMFKKRNRPKKAGTLQPSASPLHSDDVPREKTLAVSQAALATTNSETEIHATETTTTTNTNQQPYKRNEIKITKTTEQSKMTDKRLTITEAELYHVTKTGDLNPSIMSHKADFPDMSRLQVKSTISSIVLSENIVDSNKKSHKDTSARNPKPKNKVSRKSKSVVTSKPQTSKDDISSSSEAKVMNKKKAENESVWPVKHAAVLEGDIILGGLMMVHGRAAGGAAGGAARCGPLMAQGGVQALEAMLFALDEAERAELLPPGVKLGALVLDDCDSDTRGLEMALDFIKGSISNIDDEEYGCNSTAVRKVISGVVGAASSVTSVQVANLLRLFKIPQVSFFSTSPELSNKARFEYFTRTIPSDLHQVRAMVEIVKRFAWRYVSIIYEESNYGIKAFEELETLLQRDDICIAVKERLAKDSGAADDRAYDAIVERLLSRPRARGVIVFGSDQEVAGVMAAAGRRGASHTFSWVGSDGWSARALVAAGNEPVVEGTVSVQPQANPVRGFTDYFLALTPQNNLRNPWFVEFWEEQFRCRYSGSPRARHNAQFPPCSGSEQLSADNTEFEAQLQFVADAVWAFVYAIRDMHRELCGARAGLCEAMRPVSGPALLRYLRRVRFIGLSGDEFHFDAFGDGPARYNILHFKQVSRGVYRWVKVGQYLDGELQLQMDEIQFKWDEPHHPESVCSAECELGQAKQYVEGESCCWHCFNCTQYEIRSPVSATACVECARGSLPDARRTACARVPELYLRAASPAAIGAMAFSAVGILLTMLVGGVWLARCGTPVVRASGRELSFVLLAGILMCYLVTFALVFRPTDFLCAVQRLVGGVWLARCGTPVVRASGRELSFVLLAGILMCYLVTFALVFRPTDFLCAVQRFSTGFCFTVVYAALLTKTNRIARIFDASKHSARRPSLISPKSQLLICTILVSIQVVIVVVWQLASPARAIHHYPTREDNMLVCDSYVDASYTIAFFYPVVLIVICTVYAVLTRKIPEAFNESKHIGFTMYTTCVIWLAFVPLYFGTASHVPLRVTSMAVTISLSASVTLACLFAPKMYIILIRPERNVRGNLMPSKWRARGGRGAAPGAVCAALVGAAPLPRNTPSTDLSTLDTTERSTSTDRQVQTEDTNVIPKNGAIERNGLCLDPKKLAELGGLPALGERSSAARRRRAAAEPAVRVAVAVVGARPAL